MCNKHADETAPRTGPVRGCLVVGCPDMHYARGYCARHYERKDRNSQVGLLQRTSQEVLVRDAEGHKQCLRCGLWKPESSFYAAKHTSDHLQPHCKACTQEQAIFSRMKMDGPSYEAKLLAQGGACSICGNADGRLVIDHDHECCPGEYSCGKCHRGLLCAGCNKGLGFFRDNPETLKSAINYLERFTRL